VCERERRGGGSGRVGECWLGWPSAVLSRCWEMFLLDRTVSFHTSLSLSNEPSLFTLPSWVLQSWNAPKSIKSTKLLEEPLSVLAGAGLHEMGDFGLEPGADFCPHKVWGYTLGPGLSLFPQRLCSFVAHGDIGEFFSL